MVYYRLYMTRIRCILLALAVLLSFSQGLYAQANTADVQKMYTDSASRGGISFSLECSTEQLTIAETFNLKLSGAVIDKFKLELPDMEDLLAESDFFSVLDTGKPVTRLLEDGRTEISVEYRLEPIDTGSLSLPELVMEYYEVNDDDQSPEVMTLVLDGPKLMVTDILPTDSDPELSDIKGPVELPIDYSRFIWYALAIFAVVIILLFVAHKMANRQLAAPTQVQRPAHEIALERLRALVAENLLEKGQVKEFYEKLSYIIRLYIEHRFSLKAPERTTEEFLQEASASSDMPDAFKDKLKEFLMHCDMVKFAKYAPTPEEITRSTDLAKNFIEATANSSVNA